MRHLLSLFVLATVLGIAAPARADVDIVATVPDLAAIAKEIGGKHVKVTSLSLPTQDPHFVDAKPSLVLKLNKADLLIAVGLDLEVGWLPPLQTQARNSAIQSGGAGFLDCSAFVVVRDLETGKVDRSQGDVHPGGNPHYLYDPRQAAGCAKAIGARLASLDRKNAKAYKKGLDAFLADLEERRADWEQRMAERKGAGVISYHKSMSYLVDWLELDEIATLEPKPGIPPTAKHVASVIKAGKAAKVKVILQESFYPDKTGKLVAKKIGATVVSLPSGCDVSSGERYADHLETIVADLEEALE
jgi:zinc/manganese transport system substrate-binding protein